MSKAPLYPSEKLRNRLIKLGVPRHKHNLAELGEKLAKAFRQLPGIMINNPRGAFKKLWVALTGFDNEAENRAKMLIYLIENKLLKEEPEVRR